MPKKRTQPAGMPPELAEAIQQMFMGFAPPEMTAGYIAGELEDLPRRPESWLVVTHPVSLGESEALLSLVVCPDSPEPLLFQPLENAEELLRFVVESMGMGQGEGDNAWEPYVPAQFLVNDTQLAFTWGNLLREAGIQVNMGVPPELDAMVRQAAQQFALAMANGGARQTVPFLQGHTPEEAKEVLAAFDGFMKARPWNWLDDRPMFVQWQDDQGQLHSLYAVVMGHNNQEFGLSLFDCWTDYLEVALAGSSSEMMAAVVAQGGREAVNLAHSGAELSDEDWDFMQEHRLTREKREKWSGGVQQRIGIEGSLAPRHPLPMVTALLKLLAENAPAARRDYVTSFKRKTASLRVSYPGTARDELSPAEAQAWIRVRIKVRDRRVEYREKKALTLEIVAQGDTLLGKVFSGKQFQRLWQTKLDVAKWTQSDRTSLNYDLPDWLYRLVEVGGEPTQLFCYSRNEMAPTLAQVLALSQRETVYVIDMLNRFGDDDQHTPLDIAQVDGPMQDAVVEEKGVAMRWLE
ncbi:DUF7309 domain-containing protein [Deinococcus wulumuqiensis]|uniref:DUF7309 domain-containing protein n=1 Tax=Deinococcus wulumuqiensis TaxID=980427 RepID=UPI0024322445|nr:hypothetical protein [Deinococcus wulumuqiensis]